MVDTRFHAAAAPSTLTALLGVLGHSSAIDDLRAAELLIHGAAELEIAGAGHLALAAHARYAEPLRATTAGAVVVLPDLRGAVPSTAVAIVHAQPHELFVDLLEALYPDSTRAATLALLASGTPQPLVEPGVRIAASAVIGPGVEIGAGTLIGPNTVIGAHVAIGPQLHDRCQLYR